jgi:hypothetical protein
MYKTATYTSGGSYPLRPSIGEQRESIGASQETHSTDTFPLFLVGRLDDAGVRLKQPIGMLLESDNEVFVISEPLFGVYGEGDNPQSALRDFKSALVDYAKMLLDRKDESEQDFAQFDMLNKYVTFPR